MENRQTLKVITASYREKHVADNLNKIVKKTTEIELRYTETPESDIIHATGCKKPSSRLSKSL
jgi:hypothetical protein